MKRLLLGLVAFALVAGAIVLLLVPAAGNQYRLWRDAKTVEDYRRAVAALDTLACGTILAQAQAYNAELQEIALPDAFDEAGQWADDPGARLLDVTDSGVIAVLEIPKMGVTLPVYRGLSQAALARGVVHVKGTSLPIGGEGTHCALAGEGGGRFADELNGLSRLIAGDCFTIETLQDTLTYEVEGLEVVEPGALAGEALEPETDACTLMTAIERDGEPLRLLVRARRVSRMAPLLDDDTQLLPGWAARMILAAPVALAGLILLALIEALHGAVKRRRLRRMRL